MNEIVFDKYQKRGADYHWKQVSNHPTRMSAYVKGRYQKCLDLFIAAAGPLQGKKILDFGCGDGAFSFQLSSRGALVSGIDLAEEAVAFARLQHQKLSTGAEFFVESCYATHFADATFDGVISTDVIEHVREPERFLAEIHRVLRPGGVAVISTPIRLTEKPLDPMHVFEWFPGEFQMLIRSVFHQAEFFASHPVFWQEMSQRSKLLKIIVNLMALAWKNPFLHGRKWSLYSLQYAVCHKSLDSDATL